MKFFIIFAQFSLISLSLGYTIVQDGNNSNEDVTVTEATTEIPALDDDAQVLKTGEDGGGCSGKVPSSEGQDEFAEFRKPKPRFPTQTPEDLEEIDLDRDFPTNVKQLGGLNILAGNKVCTCGRAAATLIVNGRDTSIGNFPWTAAIVSAGNNRLFCGGSIINDRYILTASHCVQAYRKNPSQIYVFLSSTNITNEILRQRPAGTLKLKVERVIMHEKYNPFTIDNDIALLKLELKEGLIFTDGGLMPACVPAGGIIDYSGQNGTVVGWGTTSENTQEVSKTLQMVRVPVLTNRACSDKSDAAHYKNKITGNMLCAGYMKGGCDSCQGDSGGPLVIEQNKRNILIGVVSWGVGCARPNSPGVYARVSRFSKWIEENTMDANYCKN